MLHLNNLTHLSTFQQNNTLSVRQKTTIPLISQISHAQNITAPPFSTDEAKVLIVGYSPTGGGHTARTLNIVADALKNGSLAENSTVIFHLPPQWEGTPRPPLLKTLADQLLAKNINVKFSESDKPIYGYLDEKSGSSDDARILERIALMPLRSTHPSGKYHYLQQYFAAKKTVNSVNAIRNYQSTDKIDNISSISSSDLIKSLINNVARNNIYVLSDMDPALQKSAKKNAIPAKQRLDQQNHAILLDVDNINNNYALRHALLAKVLGGRGENISHLNLGEKNSLAEVAATASQLKIGTRTLLNEGKALIHRLLSERAITLSEFRIKNRTGDFSGIIAGHQTTSSGKPEKVIYIYAHKKSEIIARHITTQIECHNPIYDNKIFIFCGKSTLQDFNPLHLAYLADADGITTAGAGTSGEFIYLHKYAGAQSDLLILPIEGHNEQEAIANYLCGNPATRNHMLRLQADESLVNGDKIDVLVARKKMQATSAHDTFERFIAAINDKNTYISQAHDILFKQQPLDNKAIKILDIQKNMYRDNDLKATRRFLKLTFQLFNYIQQGDTAFPIDILFKQGVPPAIIFNNREEIHTFFDNPEKIKLALQLSSIQRVNDLPLLNEIKTVFSTTDRDSAAAEIDKIKQQLGHIMTTGF